MGLFGFGKKNEEKINEYELKKKEHELKTILGLRVLPSVHKETGKGRVRIPIEYMNNAGIYAYDPVLIYSGLAKRSTVATCIPLEDEFSFKSDRIIRMDTICFLNLGFDGDNIGTTPLNIKKIKTNPAEKIILLDYTGGLNDEYGIISDLENQVMTIGDNGVFHNLGELDTFLVLDTVPKTDSTNAVHVTLQTQLEIIKFKGLNKLTPSSLTKNYESILTKLKNIQKIAACFGSDYYKTVECSKCKKEMDVGKMRSLNFPSLDDYTRGSFCLVNINCISDEEMKPFLEHAKTHFEN